VVGESGCGKSVVARSILRIVDSPGKIVGGEILFHRAKGGPGAPVIDLAKLNRRAMRSVPSAAPKSP